MSSPYSPGGGGAQLETRVAASCIAAVLCESPVRGLPGDFAMAVQSQRAAFDHQLDDIVITGIRADGREVRERASWRITKRKEIGSTSAASSRLIVVSFHSWSAAAMKIPLNIGRSTSRRATGQARPSDRAVARRSPHYK
jgi:hypothetical protein